MNAAAIPGRIIPGILADYYGPFNIIVPSIAINATLIFALFGVKTDAGTIVFAILFGFSSGSCKFVLILSIMTRVSNGWTQS